MDQKYAVTERTWTEADFEQMGWHDCHIHALAFSPTSHELLLDIDYILEWQNPQPAEDNFRFTVASSTLVFQDVHSVDIEGQTLSNFQIDGILREEMRPPTYTQNVPGKEFWHWKIDCFEGDITLIATGFTQYIRGVCYNSDTQGISLKERGGYSFDKTGATHKENPSSPTIKHQVQNADTQSLSTWQKGDRFDRSGEAHSGTLGPHINMPGDTARSALPDEIPR